MTTKTAVYGSGADAHWGYPFGVEGLMSLEAASKHLAGLSRSTLDRLAERRAIRKGSAGSKVVFCEKSVRDYATSLEK